jgi:hypothetical protein
MRRGPFSIDSIEDEPDLAPVVENMVAAKWRKS